MDVYRHFCRVSAIASASTAALVAIRVTFARPRTNNSCEPGRSLAPSRSRGLPLRPAEYGMGPNPPPDHVWLTGPDFVTVLERRTTIRCRAHLPHTRMSLDALDPERGLKRWPPAPRSAMNRTRAARNERCCSGVSRSQSRQNDASTSRVGIERLGSRVQRRQELLIAVVTARPAREPIGLGLTLHRLPLTRPKPSLIRIDPPCGDLLEQHRRSIHRVIRQTVNQLMQLSSGHYRIVARTRGPTDTPNLAALLEAAGTTRSRPQQMPAGTQKHHQFPTAVSPLPLATRREVNVGARQAVALLAKLAHLVTAWPDTPQTT